MKLSLAWIFDHIAAAGSSSAGKSRHWSDYDIPQLIRSLSATPAEIDHFYEVTLNLDDFSLGQVIETAGPQVTVESSEWRKTMTLPMRKLVRKQGYYLIKKENKEYRWATLADVGSSKDGLLPEVYCNEEECAGDWKKNVDIRDYILEIDNISLTNRPDMWNHRGFARELAAIQALELVPEEHLVVPLPVRHYAQKTSPVDMPGSYIIDIEKNTACDRFAGIELSNVSLFPSLLHHALRLARLDVRPHNLVVDMTNYVMLDVGSPMHAFDADKLDDKTIIVRQAHAGEKLALLDDTTIELTEQDTVIADGKQPLSLAGIIGGIGSSVQPSTKTIFLEAAHFDPAAIRKSAARHKKRTESSLRFEKGLDPHGNTAAIGRYLKLLDDMSITYTTAGFIISVGTLPAQRSITVEHRFIADRLGTTVLPGRVEEILRRLGFGILVSEGSRGGIYTLTVPTWRSKDVTIKEDIVEEVGRYIGYNNIHPVLPMRAMVPQDQTQVFVRRAVKQHCAFALQMREVANYALYDEQLLKDLGLEIESALNLKNPLSENSRRLVTSLMPHLIKNIAVNVSHADGLRFFEWARVWKQNDKGHEERSVCAGVFYEKNGSFNFYNGKSAVQSLCELLGLLVEWRKIETAQPWMNGYQTAELVCQDQIIGYAGMVEHDLLARVMPGAASVGNAFAFELNMDQVAGLQHLEKRFEEPTKYQSVSLDVSMLAPFTVTVGELEDALARSDARIQDVLLVDVFEKEEWTDRRSITLRCIVQDSEKTMTKEDIDQVQSGMQAAVKKHGVEIR